MTAINVIIKRDSVHVISDGAYYLPLTGEVLAIGSKVFPLPNLNAAIALRGPMLALPMFASMLSAEFTTFEKLYDGIEGVFPLMCERASIVTKECDHQDIQLTAVGWSEVRGRYVAFAITNADSTTVKGDDVAGHRIDFGADNVAPIVDMDTLRMLGFTAVNMEGIDPVLDGVRLLEAQRALRFEPLPGLPELHVVGGFGQLTTLTKDNISQSIIVRWPDEIGLPILPHETLDEVAQRMNAAARPTRQQRRAAERAMRK